jgi:hypothetical protein
MGYLTKQAMPRVVRKGLDNLNRTKDLFIAGTKELDPVTGEAGDAVSSFYRGVNNVYKNLSSTAQDSVVTAAKGALPLGGLAYMGSDTGIGALASGASSLGGSLGGAMIGHSLANSMGAGPSRGAKGSLLRALLATTGAVTGGGTGLLAVQAIKNASTKPMEKRASFNWVGELAYDKARANGADINSALQAAGTSQLYTTAGATTGSGFGALTGAALMKKLKPNKNALLGAALGLLPGAGLGAYGGLSLGTSVAAKAQRVLPAHIKDLGYRPILSARDIDGTPVLVG